MNTRARKYNYASKKKWQTKSLKLSNEIDKYMDAGMQQHHFKAIIDFDLLESTVKHLKQINQLLSLPD